MTKEGKITVGMGYEVRWPDGFVLVHSGVSLRKEDYKPAQRPDVLILSARHPKGRQLVRHIAPKLIVLDEVLQVAATAGGRVRLADVFKLQNDLKPIPSLLLAPGEIRVLRAPAADKPGPK